MSFFHLLAQAAVVASPEAAAQQGVISYPPSFFAAQQPSSAMDMVQRLPGFAFDDGDAIRGFEGGGGNVLIDGQRPTSKTDNLEEILRRIPAAQVERIDLIRGAAPGIDLQGRSVVANVIRKPGSGALQGVIQAAGNQIYDGRTFYGLRGELSGGDGQRKWETSARFGFGADDGLGDGPGVIVRPDGTVIQRTDIEAEGDGGNYTLTGAYEQPLAGGKARINARHFGDKFKVEIDDLIRTPTPSIEETDEGYRTFENEIGIRFDRSLGERMTMELLGLNQTRDREITSRFNSPTTKSEFGLERETSETIARAVLKYRFSDTTSFEAGTEGAFNKLDSLTRFVENGVQRALPAANVRVEEKRGEVFGKGVWRPSPKWTLEGGLRYESSEITSEGDLTLGKTLHFLKPRAALTWAPTAETQVRLRFERVVGQLNFNDFVASANFQGVGVTVGNPDLDPEQAWVSEIAVEQRFWNDGVIVLTYRHSELSDVIDRGPVFTTTSVFDRPTNIGDGTKDEIVANLTLPLAKLGLKGALLKGEVTWRDSEVVDPTTGQKREISDLRPVDWEATFSHDLPQWRMTYGVDAYGGWRETSYRFDSIDTVKLKTFVRPFAEWRLQPDLVLRVELPNVTSRGLRRTRQVFDGPRNLNPTPTRIEDRDYQFGRMYYVRIRKTFGG